ncbi:MAG TPA: cytochrome c [Allosphingosinicella sp.]|nr:cytochrome c [Allosphingosinicella sp.]
MAMQGVVRFIRFALAALLGLVLLALSVIYLGSEFIIRRTYAAQLRPLAAAPAAAQIDEGRRLATLMGCNGCHEANLQGGEFFSEPHVATIHASNLTLALQNYTSEQFEAAVRQGIRNDGRSLFAMPSSAFAAVADEDLASIEAYLRSHPPAGERRPALSAGIIGRIGLLIGEFKPEAVLVREGRRLEPFQLGPEHERGRYLARVVCSECHDLDLSGGPENPDLAIAAAYDLDDFRTLMRTGVAAGGRDVGLMSRVARGRFTSFTDEEIGQLHAYLVARSQRVPGR